MYKTSLIIALLQYMFYQTVSFPQDEYSEFINYPDYGPEIPPDLCILPSNLGFYGKCLHLQIENK